MARANVAAEIDRLDALSRTRALSDGESHMLEVMLKKQSDYDRLARNGAAARAAIAEKPGSAVTPPGHPNSDAAAALPAAASIARPIGPLCSGHSTTMEDGA